MEIEKLHMRLSIMLEIFNSQPGITVLSSLATDIKLANTWTTYLSDSLDCHRSSGSLLCSPAIMLCIDWKDT